LLEDLEEHKNIAIWREEEEEGGDFTISFVFFSDVNYFFMP